MKTALYLTFLGILLTSTSLFAQIPFTAADEEAFVRIDTLAKSQKIKAALELVTQLNNRFREQGNTQGVVKSTMYRMLFSAYLENTGQVSMLAQLKKDALQARQPEKSILLSLLAEGYWSYYQNHRYTISQRTEIKNDLNENIQLWSVQKLIKESISTYSQSLSEVHLLENVPLGQLKDIIAGDTSNRHFRPTLYDLLAHRALDVLMNTETGSIAPDGQLNDKKWFADGEAFAAMATENPDSTGYSSHILQLFQELLRLHGNRKNKAAWADADLKRLRFVFQRSQADDKTALYYAALKKLHQESKGTEIEADVLFEIATLYKNRQLLPDSSDLHLVKALEYAEQARMSYPESPGGKSAAKLIEDVRRSQISIEFKQFVQPGQPFQIMYHYKNIDTVFLQLYKIPASTRLESYRLYLKDSLVKFLRTHQPIKSRTAPTPETQDYLNHNLVDKMDPLPAGTYLLIAGKYGNADTAGHDMAYSYAAFTVTDLVMMQRYLEPMAQYQVISAGTGLPVKAAVISETIRTYKNGKNLELKATAVTDESGYAALNSATGQSSIVVSLGKDSLIQESGYRYSNRNDDEKHVLFFTDRPIYRPGQTVFYKGVYYESTDEHKIIDHEDIAVTFYDVNHQVIDTAKFTTNEYGTFHGSFKIPVGKLSGRMRIETGYGAASVQVEEYKRPVFEVLFDKQKEQQKLNDTLAVSGSAVTYAGYKIAGATVNYSVSRTTSYAYKPGSQSAGRNTFRKIATGTMLTKADGNFNIRFFAADDDPDAESYTYSISASVTDPGGETRSAYTSISVGRKDLLMNIFLPEALYLGTGQDTIVVRSYSFNNLPVASKITAQWYPLQQPDRIPVKMPFNALPEAYTLSREEFLAAFPQGAYYNDHDPGTWKTGPQEYFQETTAPSGKGFLMLREKDLKPGYYRVVFTATNENKDTVKLERTVRIFNHDPAVIQTAKEWLSAERTVIGPGQSAVFRLASPAPGSAYYEIYYRGKTVAREKVAVSPEQKIIKIPARPEFEQSFAVQFFMAQNGVVYSSLQQVAIIDPAKQLDVQFLSFRNKLEPGERENWKLRITNKNGEKQMAELAATLYDASLEELNPMRWNGLRKSYYYDYCTWNMNFDQIQNGGTYWFTKYNYYPDKVYRIYEKLEDFGFSFIANGPTLYKMYLDNLAKREYRKYQDDLAARLRLLENGDDFYGMVLDNMGRPLAGVTVKAGGISVRTDRFGLYAIRSKAGQVLSFTFPGYRSYTVRLKAGKKRLDIDLNGPGNSLKEVTVAGYQNRARDQTTGSSYIVSGKEVKDVPAANQEQLLQGKAYGVNIQQTKPRMETPGPRTNFNETAFFYPDLHTDANGGINIDFTIPQSLTRYKLYGFAHTRALETMVFSRELITQKQLAISLNSPRFFREGDTIILTARLNNRSGKTLKSAASLELRDALTGNLADLYAPGEKAVRHIRLTGQGSTSVTWKLIIPSGINAITCKAMAEGGKFNDGEEMTIPVLPNSTLVTEAMPLNVQAGSSKTFEMEKLLKSGNPALHTAALTFEFTSNPAWYAVQALPYLMEYQSACSEQVFSRFYANSFASGIINSSPRIRQIFEAWRKAPSNALQSNLEKNQELKDLLLEETPWVRQSMNEAERKKQLAVLFDLARMQGDLAGTLEQLQNMQLGNGAFPWFSGMTADRYITQYIVQGMAQLKYLKLVDENAFPAFDLILNKATIYLDKLLQEDYESGKKSAAAYYLPMHYLYARSYSAQINRDSSFQKAFNYYLKEIRNKWTGMDLYQQAAAALILHRNGDHTTAMKIVSLLKERAQHDEEMGMYWASNVNGWWWYQNSVELQALLIEVFDEVAGDTAAVEEMKTWLLKNKQTTNWKTTKATTAACYALLMRGSHLLEANNEPEIKIGSYTPDQLDAGDQAKKEAGTGYRKIRIDGTQVSPGMGRIEIRNNNPVTAWGALYWQYFEQLDHITATSGSAAVKIGKQLFLKQKGEKGNVLEPLTTTNVLKQGQLLTVRIEIVAGRDMEYVQLKDMRPSGFEPVNVLSAYKYQDGLGYYESTKDASTNFFISFLRKGTYVFEYDLRVIQAGNFSNGITTLQCMYAPEFGAHSQGSRVAVKP